MMRLALAAVLVTLAATADAKDRITGHVADRVCTPADVTRFEHIFGSLQKGEYRADPRFQVTIHYLGTTIVDGTCHVRLRPAD
jgi:hypothetical protein